MQVNSFDVLFGLCAIYFLDNLCRKLVLIIFQFSLKGRLIIKRHFIKCSLLTFCRMFSKTSQLDLAVYSVTDGSYSICLMTSWASGVTWSRYDLSESSDKSMTLFMAKLYINCSEREYHNCKTLYSRLKVTAFIVIGIIASSKAFDNSIKGLAIPCHRKTIGW